MALCRSGSRLITRSRSSDTSRCAKDKVEWDWYQQTCGFVRVTGEAQSLLRQRQQELREGPRPEPAAGADAAESSVAQAAV